MENVWSGRMSGVGCACCMEGGRIVKWIGESWGRMCWVGERMGWENGWGGLHMLGGGKGGEWTGLLEEKMGGLAE